MTLIFPPDSEPDDPVQVKIAQGPMQGAPVGLAWDELGGLEFKDDVLLFPDPDGASIEWVGGKNIQPGTIEGVGTAWVPFIASGANIIVGVVEALMTVYEVTLSSGTVIAPAAAMGAGQAFAPNIFAGAHVFFPVSEGIGQAFEPFISNGGSVLSPTAAGVGVLFAPEVFSGANIIVPSAEGAGEAIVPTIVTGDLNYFGEYFAHYFNSGDYF